MSFAKFQLCFYIDRFIIYRLSTSFARSSSLSPSSESDLCCFGSFFFGTAKQISKSSELLLLLSLSSIVIFLYFWLSLLSPESLSISCIYFISSVILTSARVQTPAVFKISSRRALNFFRISCYYPRCSFFSRRSNF